VATDCEYSESMHPPRVMQAHVLGDRTDGCNCCCGPSKLDEAPEAQITCYERFVGLMVGLYCKQRFVLSTTVQQSRQNAIFEAQIKYSISDVYHLRAVSDFRTAVLYAGSA